MQQRIIENATKEAVQSLKHVLFNSIFNNLKETSIKKEIASFIDDAKLEGVANISENRDKRDEQKEVVNTGRK